MGVKIIETKYRGIVFRSRLEARWAVFFDQLGIEWQYEPQGFEKDGDRYLPDFRLSCKGGDVWAEVKGDRDYVQNNLGRLSRWFSGTPILPASKMIFLGDIPFGVGALLVFAVGCNSKGEPYSDWMTFRGKYGIAPAGELADYFLSEDKRKGFDFQPVIALAPWALKGLPEALNAARSARFDASQQVG